MLALLSCSAPLVSTGGSNEDSCWLLVGPALTHMHGCGSLRWAFMCIKTPKQHVRAWLERMRWRLGPPGRPISPLVRHAGGGGGGGHAYVMNTATVEVHCLRQHWLTAPFAKLCLMSQPAQPNDLNDGVGGITPRARPTGEWNPGLAPYVSPFRTRSAALRSRGLPKVADCDGGGCVQDGEAIQAAVTLCDLFASPTTRVAAVQTVVALVQHGPTLSGSLPGRRDVCTHGCRGVQPNQYNRKSNSHTPPPTPSLSACWVEPHVQKTLTRQAGRSHAQSRCCSQ
jgi:hypothetical protein